MLIYYNIGMVPISRHHFIHDQDTLINTQYTKVQTLAAMNLCCECTMYYSYIFSGGQCCLQHTNCTQKLCTVGAACSWVVNIIT